MNTKSAICDECQKMFKIGIDKNGDTIYLGEECDCESPFNVLSE